MSVAGRPREPIELIIAKGKKHLSKQEIEDRTNSEIKCDYTNVEAPEYLSDEEKIKFYEIAKILLDIGIISELDEDCLAHYLIANTNYIQYTKEIRNLNKKILETKRADTKKRIKYEIDTFGYAYKSNFNFNSFLNLENEKDVALAFAKCYERCGSDSYNSRKTNATKALEYFTK